MKARLHDLNTPGKSDEWWRTCNGCGRVADRVAVVGQEDGIDQRTAYLCVDCVKEALALFDSTQP